MVQESTTRMGKRSRDHSSNPRPSFIESISLHALSTRVIELGGLGDSPKRPLTLGQRPPHAPLTMQLCKVLVS
eukprot:5101913-Amphidinium_carterae.1